MRAVKFIYALGCLGLALFPARFAIVAFSRFDYTRYGYVKYNPTEGMLVYWAAGFFTILAASLIFTGGYLLVRLSSALSRKAKALILLHTFSIGIFVALVAPDICKERSDYAYDANPCINNLCVIDAAANQFALAHHLTHGQAIRFPDDLIPYLKGGKIPVCPNGGVYNLGKVGNTPTCSSDSFRIP